MSNEPELIARFATDENGEPLYVGTSPGPKHYRIIIEVKNAPPDLMAATFELDPTYYLPVRIIEPDADGKVKLETTAYGDYPLQVDLHRKSGVIPVKTTLRKALLSGAPRERGPKIDAAIAEIVAR